MPGESRSIILLEEACRRIPAYARLVQLIEARSFDVLVYLDRSRLGRKASLSMAIVELCHAAGIAICETESGGELIYGATYDQLLVGAIKSVAAQQEINKLTERHRMGMLARVQRGEWPGILPWGYKYVFSVDGQRSVAIDETAAPVIRRIFDLYLSGLGIWSIVTILNNEGAPNPGVHRNEWVYQTVRTITLRPWRYAGFVEYSFADGDRMRRPGRSPGIISPETAQRVEEMIVRKRGGRQKPGAHAFTSIVWCAVCNRPMRRNGEQLKDGRTKWRCRGGHGPSTAREDLLRETLVAAIETLAEHLDDDLFNSVADQAEIELHGEIENTKKGLDDAYARIERLDEAFAAGLMDLDRYARQIKNVQSRVDALTERMKSLQAQQRLVGAPADKLKRRQELVERGINVLNENAVEANAFLRTRVRLWCENHRVIRVEFL